MYVRELPVWGNPQEEGQGEQRSAVCIREQEGQNRNLGSSD